MKILIISNIPSPYRIDFFNELGKYVDLTVVFEAKSARGITFNWNIEEIQNFKAVFLKDGVINEKKIDWTILKYIKKNYYDHIIVTSYAYFTEMTALLALKALRIPYFLEVDGGLIRQENKLKKNFKKFLVSNAKGYFSPSNSSDDYLVYYGAKRNLIHRYPFTSLNKKDILDQLVLEEEKAILKKELGISKKKVVLAVGQFIHRKGFDVLIKASKGIDQDIGIYFVGGEPTDEYIELRNKYKSNHVYFEGFKSKEELSKYFKVADLFVLPTREDVWGLVINEAMAFGLPIITTDKCTAGLELIKNWKNGFIVESEDTDAIANRVKTILSDDKLKYKMGHYNLQTIKQYTIERMTEQHLDILYQEQ